MPMNFDDGPVAQILDRHAPLREKLAALSDFSDFERAEDMALGQEIQQVSDKVIRVEARLRERDQRAANLPRVNDVDKDGNVIPDDTEYNPSAPPSDRESYRLPLLREIKRENEKLDRLLAKLTERKAEPKVALLFDRVGKFLSQHAPDVRFELYAGPKFGTRPSHEAMRALGGKATVNTDELREVRTSCADIGEVDVLIDGFVDSAVNDPPFELVIPNFSISQQLHMAPVEMRHEPRSEQDIAFRVACWLDPEAVRSKLKSEARHHYRDGRRSMTTEARNKRMAELRRDVHAIELEEAWHFWRLLAQGAHVKPRKGISPRAILQIR